MQQGPCQPGGLTLWCLQYRSMRSFHICRCFCCVSFTGCKLQGPRKGCGFLGAGKVTLLRGGTHRRLERFQQRAGIEYLREVRRVVIKYREVELANVCHPRGGSRFAGRRASELSELGANYQPIRILTKDKV